MDNKFINKSYVSKQTVHICKFNPGSRIQMQVGWEDNKPIILGKIGAYANTYSASKNSPFQYLTLKTLFKTLKSIPGNYIFHGQSTLHHLFIGIIWRKLFSTDINITYDMHDLIEANPGFTYIYFRYLVMYILEYLVMKLQVNFITVSKGLRSEIEKRYKISRPIGIVYNIPPRNPKVIEKIHMPKKQFLYFGQIIIPRVTKKLMDKVKNAGMKLYLHGEITENISETSHMIKKYADVNVVEIIDEYTPDNLNFLSDYCYSIIDYSSSNTKNIQYCLPNKLFQSLRYGLVCLVSQNLHEIIDLFHDFPWNVLVIPENEPLELLCERIRKHHIEKSVYHVNNYLDKLEYQSKSAYFSTINNKVMNS